MKLTSEQQFEDVIRVIENISKRFSGESITLTKYELCTILREMEGADYEVGYIADCITKNFLNIYSKGVAK